MFRTINIKTHIIILKAIVVTAINIQVIHTRIFILWKITIQAINTNTKKISQNMNNQNINKEINIKINPKGNNSNNQHVNSLQDNNKGNNNTIIINITVMDMKIKQLRR